MKNSKLLVIALIILIVGSGVYYVFSNNNWGQTDIINCKQIDPIVLTKKAQVIDNQKMSYATTSRKIFGRSTDGGIQMNYIDGNKLLLVEVGLYGETVSSGSSYFLENSKVYYLHQEITRYKTSVYQKDFNPEEKTVEIRDFYLDSNENLCYWFTNQVPQPITEEIEDYVNKSILELKED